MAETKEEKKALIVAAIKEGNIESVRSALEDGELELNVSVSFNIHYHMFTIIDFMELFIRNTLSLWVKYMELTTFVWVRDFYSLVTYAAQTLIVGKQVEHVMHYLSCFL